MPSPVFTPDQLNAYVAEIFPQIMDLHPGFEVMLVEQDRVVVHMTAQERNLRPGGTVSGPTLFALADMGGYACALAHLGKEALAVTTNLNINFMRKAEMGVLVADSRILKLGKRLMVFDCSITQQGSEDIVAHATGTYAIPPR